MAAGVAEGLLTGRRVRDMYVVARAMRDEAVLDNYVRDHDSNSASVDASPH